MSTIGQGEQMKLDILKASFLFAYRPSPFEIPRLYRAQEFLMQRC